MAETRSEKNADCTDDQSPQRPSVGADSASCEVVPTLGTAQNAVGDTTAWSSPTGKLVHHVARIWSDPIQGSSLPPEDIAHEQLRPLVAKALRESVDNGPVHGLLDDLAAELKFARDQLAAGLGSRGHLIVSALIKIVREFKQKHTTELLRDQARSHIDESESSNVRDELLSLARGTVSEADLVGPSDHGTPIFTSGDKDEAPSALFDLADSCAHEHSVPPVHGQDPKQALDIVADPGLFHHHFHNSAARDLLVFTAGHHCAGDARFLFDV